MARGEEMQTFHCCATLGNAYGAEGALIQAVAERVQRAGGREWFRHGNVSHAIRAAEEITDYYLRDVAPLPKMTPEERAALTARLAVQVADRAVQRQKRAIVIAQARREKELRKRVRQAAGHAIAAMVSVLIATPGAPAVPEAAKA